ncbi:MAG: DNA repair protein RecO [Xanthomonadales bacterium]|nr:DNA repair protein RecO [Xanthomonadales bacterium]
MRISQQPALILHSRPYRETSLLLEVFSREHGRIGLVARGIRRERSRMPRGLLQPLQPLLLDWVARGELGTLAGAEAASRPFALGGEGLLAAMYVNELVLRLTPRGDPAPSAFDAYATCLDRLAGEDLAWTLRRFERDFLAEIGYAMVLAHDSDGEAIEEGSDYAYDPDAGPRPWHAGSPFVRVAGAALLALQADVAPPAAGLNQLRRLARAVIRHLAGGELKAWALAVRTRG